VNSKAKINGRIKYWSGEAEIEGESVLEELLQTSRELLPHL
jgi:hypothetical protein